MRGSAAEPPRDRDRGLTDRPAARSAQAASELAALDDYARLHGAWDELPMLVGGTVGVAGPGPGPARRQVAKAGAFVRRIPRNVRHLLAGALSGACGKTATAPIEAVRMRVMVGQGTARACVAKVWAAGGPLAFFQGNLADVVRVAPQKAIQLAAFDAFKKTFARPDETGKPVTAPHLCFLSGGLAGIASTVACYPLETLRTRLGCDSTYNGLVDCTVRMWREEGPLSLYKGLSASVVGVIPYAALNLGLYDSMKKVYLRLTREERVPNQIAGAFGALAGPLAATGTFPLEVVRRRAMMGEVYANVPAAVLTIYRREGLPALFKGCGLTWIKHAPSAFITFTLYETFKEQLLLK